jgi:hypothetical protein
MAVSVLGTIANAALWVQDNVIKGRRGKPDCLLSYFTKLEPLVTTTTFRLIADRGHSRRSLAQGPQPKSQKEPRNLVTVNQSCPARPRPTGVVRPGRCRNRVEILAELPGRFVRLPETEKCREKRRVTHKDAH